MKSIFLFLALFFIFQANAQKYIEPSSFEDEISILKGHIDQSKDDNEKISKSRELVAQFIDFYQTKEAFEYTFEKIKTIGFINSPDNLLKIINWNIEKQDHTNHYFGLIVRYDSKAKKYFTYELNHIIDPNQSITGDYYSNENWYGALYYKIIPTSAKNKMIYTVLGYDAHTKTSQIKLIDAITFTNKKAKFGHPFFQGNGKKALKRVLFEYSKKSYMALKFEPERNRIVFDHLSPEDPTMVDFRQFYVPDMSYDAFTYDGIKWNLQTDIVAINPNEKNKTVTTYGMSKDGELIATERKSKWIDPSDKNAPGGANIHTINLPDENGKKIKVKIEKEEKNKRKQEKRASKIRQKDKTFTPYEVILKNKNKKRRH